MNLNEILESFEVRDNGGYRTRLLAALVEREDAMKDQLFLAGAQFGLFAPIVAEVVATIGLGTPPSDEERAMIHATYVDLMNRIIQAQQGNGEMPQP